MLLFMMISIWVGTFFVKISRCSPISFEISSPLLCMTNHFSNKNKCVCMITIYAGLDNVTHYEYHMPTTKDPLFSFLFWCYVPFYSSEFRDIDLTPHVHSAESAHTRPISLHFGWESGRFDDLTLTTIGVVGFVDFSVLAWRSSKPIEIYAFRFCRVFMRGLLPARRWFWEHRKANCQFILHDSKTRPHTPIFRLEWVIWPLFLYERLWLSLKCTLYAWKQSKSDASISTIKHGTLLIVGRSPMENEMQSLNEGVAGCHFLLHRIQ